MCYEFDAEYWEELVRREQRKAGISEEIKRAVMSSEAPVPVAEAE